MFEDSGEDFELQSTMNLHFSDLTKIIASGTFSHDAVEDISLFLSITTEIIEHVILYRCG